MSGWKARKKNWRSFGTMLAQVVNVTVREEVEDLIGPARADFGRIACEFRLCA